MRLLRAGLSLRLRRVACPASVWSPFSPARSAPPPVQCLLSPAQRLLSPAQRLLSPAQRLLSPVQPLLSPVQLLLSPVQPLARWPDFARAVALLSWSPAWKAPRAAARSRNSAAQSRRSRNPVPVPAR